MTSNTPRVTLRYVLRIASDCLNLYRIQTVRYIIRFKDAHSANLILVSVSMIGLTRVIYYVLLHSMNESILDIRRVKPCYPPSQSLLSTESILVIHQINHCYPPSQSLLSPESIIVIPGVNHCYPLSQSLLSTESIIVIY